MNDVRYPDESLNVGAWPNPWDWALHEAMYGYIGNPADQSAEAQRMRRHLWRKAARNQAWHDLDNALTPIIAAVSRIPWMLWPWLERPYRAIERRIG